MGYPGPTHGWSIQGNWRLETMSLTLDEARAVSARVREDAAELGAQVTVAIVDGGGHLKFSTAWTAHLRYLRASPRLKPPVLRCSTATVVNWRDSAGLACTVRAA